VQPATKNGGLFYFEKGGEKKKRKIKKRKNENFS